MLFYEPLLPCYCWPSDSRVTPVDSISVWFLGRLLDRAASRFSHWDDSERGLVATRGELKVDQVSFRQTRLCKKFEQAWKSSDEVPDLADYLRQVSASDDNASVGKFVRIDLEHRWRRFGGHSPNECVLGLPARPTLQDYIDHLGKLFTNDQVTPELVAEEQRVRERWGSAVTFDRVQALCEDFAEQYRTAMQPRIENYLVYCPADAAEILIRNLIQLELGFRQEQGEEPAVDEYRQRFPQFVTVVEDVFHNGNSTIQGTIAGLETDAYPPTGARSAEWSMQVSSSGQTYDAEPLAKEHLSFRVPSRLGSYQLIRELGRGGMGTVYEAVHSHDDTHVALKTLPRVDAVALHHFKREFRSLADFDHPNLISLYTLEADGPQWFLTMELVNGSDFLSYVRPWGILDETRLRQALRQLGDALLALHSHHVIHRDLKPSNVMVSGTGHVKLLDFGLVFEEEQTSVHSAEAIMGTPLYMAPEQAAQQPVTPASDWYAVGVMLYEALTGRLPYRGSVLEVLREKTSIDPPPIEDLALPPDLVNLCMSLLSRDPELRPSSINVNVCESGVELSSTPPTFRTDELLVGRDQQIKALSENWSSVQNEQRAGVVFVSGRSGEGKSSLVEQFLKPLRADPSVTVLTGRCYDRESVPFKAVDNLIDALTAYLRGLPAEAAAMLMPRDVAVLAQLFPVLNRVRVIANAPRPQLKDVDDHQVRKLAGLALRELFLRITDRTPVVLFIDDLQWGDADGAQLLHEVLRAPNEPRLLLLGTYRSDEAERSPFLQEWTRLENTPDNGVPVQHITVEPLSEGECLKVVRAHTGLDDDSLRQQAARIADETGGNPYLLSQLLENFDASTGSFELFPMHELVAQRLQRLSVEAANLLEVVSVAGQALTLEEAVGACGYVGLEIAAFTQMRKQRLVRLLGDEAEDQLVDTYHDRVRESVLRKLDVAKRKEWHIRLGEEIEKGVANGATEDQLADETVGGRDLSTNPRIYDLAYHFFEGEDPRAFAYQLQAGEAAIEAYALEKAYDHLDKARQVLPEDAEPQVKYRLWERLGDACSRTERLPEAKKYYEKSLEFADGCIERAVVCDGIGETLHRLGDFDAAIDSFDQAFVELGFHRPKSLPVIILQMGWLLTLCFFHWLVRPYRNDEDRHRARIATEVAHHLCQIYLLTDVLRYADVSARMCFYSLRSGDTGLICEGFAKLGFNNSVSGLSLPARLFFSRAQRLADQTDSPWAKTIAQFYECCHRYIRGQLTQSEQTAHEIQETVERQGQTWVRMSLVHTLRHVYHVQGRSDKELQMAEIERQIGEAVSEPDTICWAHYGFAVAKARLGLVQEAEEHMRLSTEALGGLERPLSRGIMLHHYGFVRLQASDYAGATDLLELSRQEFESNFIYLEYMLYAYPRLMESLIGPDWLEPRKNNEIRRARRLLLKTQFFARLFPNLRPHAFRVKGRLLCVTGRRHKSSYWFQKSIDSARQIGAEYDVARGLLDLAAVDEERRDTHRSEAVEILRHLKAVIPNAERWQLGEHPDESCLPRP